MDSSSRNNIMYHSQLPLQQLQPQRNQKDIMRMSLMDLNGNFHSEKVSTPNKKNLSFKYKRVNNMFKLVEVEQNCQEVKSKVSQVDQVTEAMKKLNARVTQLQKKMEKEQPNYGIIIDAVRQEITWLAERDNQIQGQIELYGSQIKELRQRIQQMQEQQSSHNTTIDSINSKIQQFKQVLPSIDCNFNKQFEAMVKQKISLFSAEFSKTLEEIKKRVSVVEQQKYFRDHEQANPFNLRRNKIDLKLSQVFEDLETGNSYLVNQNLYQIDNQGRILDSDGYRIVGPRNKQLKLSPQHINKLRQFGILR